MGPSVAECRAFFLLADDVSLLTGVRLWMHYLYSWWLEATAWSTRPWLRGLDYEAWWLEVLVPSALRCAGFMRPVSGSFFWYGKQNAGFMRLLLYASVRG